jgi:hypothetical protein
MAGDCFETLLFVESGGGELVEWIKNWVQGDDIRPCEGRMPGSLRLRPSRGWMRRPSLNCGQEDEKDRSDPSDIFPSRNRRYNLQGQNIGASIRIFGSPDE